MALRIKPVYILTGIAALLGLGAMAQKRAAGFISYFLRNLAIAFEGATPILRLTVAVQNPTNQEFVIKSIAGFVYADTEKIGTISMFETVIVRANSSQDLNLFVRLNASAVASDLIALISRGSGIPQKVEVKAIVNANGFVSDMTLTYNVTG